MFFFIVSAVNPCAWIKGVEIVYRSYGNRVRSGYDILCLLVYPFFIVPVVDPLCLDKRRRIVYRKCGNHWRS